MSDHRTSAFEKEICEKLTLFGQWLKSRDRFVLITLCISVAPLPLFPVLSIAIAGFQLWLIKVGKLDAKEITLLWLAILLSVVNILVTLSFIMTVVGKYDELWDYLKNILVEFSKPWMWLEHLQKKNSTAI